jgi:hypothetical protein
MRIETIDGTGAPVVVENFPDYRHEELVSFVSDHAGKLGFRAKDMEPLTHLVGQLAFLEAEPRATEYEDRYYRTLLPGDCVTSEAGEWAETVLYRIKDRRGKMARIHPSATKMPMVGTSTAQGSVNVGHYGVGYGYNLQQLRTAARYLTPLPADEQEACVEAAEDKIDEVAMQGETESGFKGLLSHTSVDANNRNSGAVWDSATADTIANDINTLLGNVYVKSKTKYPASHLVLPPSRIQRLMQLRATGVNDTLLKWIRTNNLFTQMKGETPLTIVAGPSYLETAGASGSKRALAYTPKRENVKFHLPMPQRFLAPQMEGLMVVVYSEVRMGGLDFSKVYTGEYMDGL